MHPKAHGKSAEWLFAYEAVEHNWVPLVEPTDALPYDVVLVKHCSSTFIKCQVKMTASERKNRDGFYNVNLSKGAGANKKAYLHDDFDFWWLYISNARVWYIIPREATSNTRKVTLPESKYANSKWTKFHSAWHLLEEALS